MVFEDIFSKRKNIRDFVKPLIIVDVHEKNSLVACELVSLGASINFEHLEIGDYLVNGVAIERKTLSDFISSMISKRIFSQLNNLKKYDKRLLIIEESDKNISDFSNINPNAVKGFIISIILDFDIPIIMTKNSEDTARFIFLLSKKSKSESSFRESRSGLSFIDRLQFILEGFPFIGPVKAKALLEKFGNIRRIINADKNELSSVLGKNSEDFLDLINRDYFSL